MLIKVYGGEEKNPAKPLKLRNPKHRMGMLMPTLSQVGESPPCSSLS